MTRHVHYLALAVLFLAPIALAAHSPTFTRETLNTPALVPDQSIDWDTTGTLLASAYTSSPFLSAWERSGTTTYTPMTLNVNPPGLGTGARWSPDGTMIAVSHFTTPFVSVYSRSGTALTKLANPSVLPSANGYDVAWSVDGDYLAVVSPLGSPTLNVYSVSGTTFTKLTNPGTLPTTPICLSWGRSSEGTDYLAVRPETSASLVVYTAIGSTVTHVGNAGGYTDDTGCVVSWSLDATHLATANAADATDKIVWWSRDGSTFTKLTTPTTAGITSIRCLDWSPDGLLLMTTSTNTPFVHIYERSGDTLTKLANPSLLPTAPGNSQACSWAGTGDRSTVPGLTTYTVFPPAIPPDPPVDTPNPPLFTRDGAITGNLSQYSQALFGVPDAYDATLFWIGLLLVIAIGGGIAGLTGMWGGLMGSFGAIVFVGVLTWWPIWVVVFGLVVVAAVAFLLGKRGEA